MRFLSAHSSSSRGRGSSLLAFCTALLVGASASVASAQAAPDAAEPPVVPLDKAPAPSAPDAPAIDGATASKLSGLTQELLRLEEQTLRLEAARDAVRTTGYRVGKIVCWSVSALVLLNAFSWWGQAQAVEEALKEGRDDEAYDVNGNDKVTKHDEDVARTVARTLAITSLIPIGLGVFTTMFELRRVREKRRLTDQIEDLALRRRTLLRRLSGQLSASQVHAALELQLRF